MTRLWSLLVATPLVALMLVAAVNTNWGIFGAGGRSAATPMTIPAAPIEFVGQLRGAVDTGRVGVIEFADFQCPFSRAFAREVQPRLFEEYVDTGQVVWSFRHLPLTSIHAEARPAADVSECVASTAGFWPVHDRLFERWQGTPLHARDLSSLLDLDPQVVQACLGRAHPRVDRDLRTAAALGVTVTPTFLVGPIDQGRMSVKDMIIGTPTIERIRTAIEASLAQVGAPVPAVVPAASGGTPRQATPATTRSPRQ